MTLSSSVRTDLATPPGARAQLVPYLNSPFDGYTILRHPDRFFGRCSRDRDVAVEVHQWVQQRVPARRAFAAQVAHVASPTAMLLAVPMVLSALVDAGAPIPDALRGTVLLAIVAFALIRCVRVLTDGDRISGRRSAAVEWLHANTTVVRDPQAARATLGVLQDYLAEVDPYAPAETMHARILDTAGTLTGQQLHEDMSIQIHQARARRLQQWSSAQQEHPDAPMPLIRTRHSSIQDAVPQISPVPARIDRLRL